MKAEAFEQEYIDRIVLVHAFGSRQPARTCEDSNVTRELARRFGISLQQFWKILDRLRRTRRPMPVIAFRLGPGGFEHIINVRATIHALIWMCDWVARPLA